jgi:hypothetical protein
MTHFHEKVIGRLGVETASTIQKTATCKDKGLQFGNVGSRWRDNVEMQRISLHKT